MIVSVAEIKSYLNIVDTTIDNELLTLINACQFQVENYCNRSLESNSISEIQLSSGNKSIYLNNSPITAISKIEIQQSDNTWLEIDKTYISYINSRIFYTDGNTFLDDTIYKITYTGGYKSQTGTGTLSIAISTKAVTGVGTLFLAELVAGDKFICEGQSFIVDTITSNTVMTVISNASAAISGKSFVISNVPFDLKQTIIEMVAIAFKQSGIAGGSNTLGMSSVGEGGAIGITTSFKDYDWKLKVELYRRINI